MKIYILPEVKSSPWIDLSSVAGAPPVPGLLSVDKEMIQANTNMLPPTMIKQNLPLKWGRDRMVVGFTTTYAISAYHYWCCEFESRLGRGVQHYMIKFVSDLRQVGGFLRVLRFPPPIKLTATI